MKKTLLILSVCAVILYGWHNHSLNKETSRIRAEFERQSRLDILGSKLFVIKISELKKEVVEKLRKCESAGFNEDDGLITFDPSSKMKSKCATVGAMNKQCLSFGEFQYKIDTLKSYYLKLYNKKLTTKEAIEIALNTKKSRALTNDIIFKEIGGIYNWKNCEARNNLGERIEIIRELMK